MTGRGAVSSKIDWKEVRTRLAATAERIDAASRPGPDETRRILKERAAALAAIPPNPLEGESLDVLEFILARETWAIEASFVHEVSPLTDLTALPGTPRFVLGIVNLRGEIVSIIDIRQFFDLPAVNLTELNKVIVLRDGEMTFGVLADAVLGVRRVPLAEIQPALPTLTGIREKYLKGITNDRKVVLDGLRLIHDEAIVVK